MEALLKRQPLLCPSSLGNTWDPVVVRDAGAYQRDIGLAGCDLPNASNAVAWSLCAQNWLEIKKKGTPSP